VINAVFQFNYTGPVRLNMSGPNLLRRFAKIRYGIPITKKTTTSLLKMRSLLRIVHNFNQWSIAHGVSLVLQQDEEDLKAKLGVDETVDDQAVPLNEEDASSMAVMDDEDNEDDVIILEYKQAVLDTERKYDVPVLKQEQPAPLPVEQDQAPTSSPRVPQPYSSPSGLAVTPLTTLDASNIIEGSRRRVSRVF
jgi:hypothetical protein